MFQLISNFWNQILAIFVPSSYGYAFNVYHRLNASGMDTSVNVRSGSQVFPALVNLLSYGTLIGLCVFLFYQVYKLIHALIGGVYE